MYENQTFNTILQRMLVKVKEYDSTIDTREGSIIYNAIAPAAAELVGLYASLDVILNNTFADTASRIYLIKRAAERGITPTPATKAILRGIFNMDIAIGARFSLSDLNYIVTEKISDGVFKLECETAGTAGNEYLGTLIPVVYIDGLTSASLTELLIPGEDEESTEALRDRYFESITAQAFGGNKADYKQKVEAIDGVGGVRVYPAWNGGGTVKLAIINSSFGAPSQALIDTVQGLIDPPTQGSGSGIAPIGHVVTVTGATTTTVNIAFSLTYASGWEWADISEYVNQAIDAYFLELAEVWADGALVVRVSQIETRILAINGVVDISGTTLNSATNNLTLSNDSIPIRGTVSDI